MYPTLKWAASWCTYGLQQWALLLTQFKSPRPQLVIHDSIRFSHGLSNQKAKVICFISNCTFTRSTILLPRFIVFFIASNLISIPWDSLINILSFNMSWNPIINYIPPTPNIHPIRSPNITTPILRHQVLDDAITTRLRRASLASSVPP